MSISSEPLNKSTLTLSQVLDQNEKVVDRLPQNAVIEDVTRQNHKNASSLRSNVCRRIDISECWCESHGTLMLFTKADRACARNNRQSGLGY